MKKIIWLVFLGLILSRCTTKSNEIPLAFYYWKTTFNLSETEKEYLNALDVKKLYIRYFDVALKDSSAIPIAPIVFNQLPENYQIVPVIYIKNEVFLQHQHDSLHHKIYNFIQQINQSANININEIQFDCDWSIKSKQNYFDFLQNFKKLHPHISATIRLHQIKYPEKTGVPEVTSGLLMHYNMGTISSDNKNSIYDQSISKRYITSLSNYKLPLNVALPIFSWGVHIRKNQVVNLISGMRTTDFDLKYFEKIDENRFKVRDDFMFDGRFLAKDDVIKIEEIKPNQLKEMVSDLKKYMKTPPNEIILYDLNKKNLEAYEKEVFKKISNW